MDTQMRKATNSDTGAISNLVLAAFGTEGPEIAELISDLMADPTACPRLALVATLGEQVVGHVLFTKIEITQSPKAVSAFILAPLAVHPDHQNRGIGGQLINGGLKQLKAMGGEIVFVLGHPGYYPRYGFTPVGTRGLDAPHNIPDEHADAWMVQTLKPGALAEVHGAVRCADTLQDPKYWGP